MFSGSTQVGRIKRSFAELAGWLDDQLPSLTYLWDFIAIWLIFGIFRSGRL